MLVRLGGPVLDPAYEASEVDLEELVLGYMGASATPAYARPRGGWRRPMTWLVWRQYRAQAAIAALLLAALAAVLVVTGLQMASQWHSMVAACTVHAAGASACLDVSLGGARAHDLIVLTAIVPAVLGFLWGAPLVAQELETGTVNFAWTQSITRARWLAVKAGLAAARRRGLGRRGRRPGHLVVGPAQRPLPGPVPAEHVRRAGHRAHRLRGVRHGARRSRLARCCAGPWWRSP